LSQSPQKIALVTGAARGIGAAICSVLDADGWSVIGFDRTWPDAINLPLLAHFTGDVTDYGAVEEVVTTVEREFGSIGLLVNNAGITRDAFAHKMDPQAFRMVIDVNLVGSFHFCRAVLPSMRERGTGRIVSISSMNALKGQMGQANYAASKAGLIAMTKSIAQENARHGITVNCVAPGFIKTDMTDAMRDDIREAEAERVPVGRIGEPREIADAVAFLASEKAAFITGQVLSVNGGQVMT
jgi:acetoacetyl-CoA reductase